MAARACAAASLPAPSGLTIHILLAAGLSLCDKLQELHRHCSAPTRAHGVHELAPARAAAPHWHASQLPPRLF
eukprot:3835561-Rhodomonas_salina.3